MLPSYYGVRRPFISDSDFSNKQFSPDVYSTTLAGKPLSCESAAMSGYPSLIDSYYPEAFGDYRSATAFSSPGGSFLPPSALSSLLPSYGGESSHLFLVGRVRLRGEKRNRRSSEKPRTRWPLSSLPDVSSLISRLFQRDSWDQSVPEPVSQVEPLCTSSLASVPPSMSSPDPPGSPSQYRSPSRSSSMSAQPYTLHPLEDAHYHSLTPSTSYPLPSTSFPCPPYTGSPIGDLVSKMVTEETTEGQVGLSADGEGHPCWPKEDGMNSWSPYEVRRAF